MDLVKKSSNLRNEVKTCFNYEMQNHFLVKTRFCVECKASSCAYSVILLSCLVKSLLLLKEEQLSWEKRLIECTDLELGICVCIFFSSIKCAPAEFGFFCLFVFKVYVRKKLKIHIAQIHLLISVHSIDAKNTYFVFTGMNWERV